jgi:rhamnosyltransferase
MRKSEDCQEIDAIREFENSKENSLLVVERNMNRRTCAVIVTYWPNMNKLHKLIGQITHQVNAVVVVDNTSWSTPEEMISTIGQSTYLPMTVNCGIASAFNVGIDWARNRGFSHVLLLDQDSLPSETMVEKLSIAETHLLEHGHNVAAVGPVYSDPKYRVIMPFTRTGKWRVRRYQCKGVEGPAFIQSDFVISSGSLIRIAVLDAVGKFDESFFIDYVDIEWGLRAKNLGFSCYGVCDAALKHSLGEDAITFWCLKTWSVPVHEALRHYYFFRNAILMYRRPYVPLVWKLRDLSMLVLKAMFFSIVPSPRWTRFRMISLGLYDGLRNRSGPFGTAKADDASPVS